MTKYVVYIPVTASIAIEVNAESEEEAKEKAFESDYRLIVEGDADLVDWEVHPQVVKGNVFYGVINEIEVAEIE